MQNHDINLDQEVQSSAEQEISVVEIINMMLSFWWFIVAMAILVGGSSYAYYKVTSVPQYTSNARVLVSTQAQQTSTDVNTGAIVNAGNLLPTYIDVLRSKVFLEQVSDDLDNRYSVGAIKGMLTMEAVKETNILSITVKNTDAHVAYLVCSSIVNNAPSEIARVFGGGSTKITEYPVEADSAAPIKTGRNAVVGAVAGAAIAMVIIFLVNMFDTRVKHKDELVNRYGLPILGEIPNLDITR